MKILFSNKILFFFVVTLFFAACNNSEEKKIDAIQVAPVPFDNMEDELFAITSANIQEKGNFLSHQYQIFFIYYLENVLGAGSFRDSLSKEKILQFINDKDIELVYKEVKKSFPTPERKKIENNLLQLHKYLKYYFPSKPIPEKYVSCVTGFNYQIMYPDSGKIIGIGLDMYLGQNNYLYQLLQWPQYRVRQLNKEYITCDVAKAWLFNNFSPQKFNNLLENMMYYGKIFYALDKLLPNEQDSIKWAYTPAQLGYCNKYEKNLWGFFVEDNKLYDNNPKIISTFLNDGPFTAAINKECPPRIAMYVGYRIVKQYMQNNKGVNLEQLMQENNAQKILQHSKYKP